MSTLVAPAYVLEPVSLIEPHFASISMSQVRIFAEKITSSPGHVINGWYENMEDAINTRLGAQILIENSVWSGIKKCVISSDAGFAVIRGSDLGGGTNSAATGSLTSVPYSYTLLPLGSVASVVGANQGAVLSL